MHGPLGLLFCLLLELTTKTRWLDVVPGGRNVLRGASVPGWGSAVPGAGLSILAFLIGLWFIGSMILGPGKAMRLLQKNK